MDDLEKQVRRLLADVFGLEDGDLPTVIDVDTVEKWDSLAHLNMVEQLEATFGVSIPHEVSVELLDERAVVEHLRKAGVS